MSGLLKIYLPNAEESVICAEPDEFEDREKILVRTFHMEMVGVAYHLSGFDDYCQANTIFRFS